MSKNNKSISVSCGFSKWYIGWDYESAAVTVSFGRHPNFGDISLHDASLDELRSIANMFNHVADVLEGKIKK